MIEVKSTIEVRGGGRRFSVSASVRRPNRYLRKPDALRGAASGATDEAALKLPDALRAEDPPRMTLVGSQATNPATLRFNFRRADGSPFWILFKPSRGESGEISQLEDSLSPDELAEVCRLISEDRKHVEAEAERRASRGRSRVT